MSRYQRPFVRSMLAAAAAAGLICTSAIAQQPGDLVLSAVGPNPGVYYSNFATGTTSTISTESSQAVLADKTFIVYATSTRHIRSKLGNLTLNYGQTSATPSGIEIGTDGAYRVTAFDKKVYRAALSSVQPEFNTPTAPNGIMRDLTTGDYLIASATSGHVYRSTQSGGFTTLMLLGAKARTAVLSMPNYVAVGSLEPNGLYVGLLNGVGVNLPISDVNALAGEHNTDTLYAATFGGEVYKLQGGVIVQVQNYGAGYKFTGIDIVGNRKVRARRLSRTTYQIPLYFPNSPNQPYCVALSLGTKPAIPFVGNQSIHLAPDDLFFLTACKNIPGFTKNFVGTLNNNGQSMAEVTIPPGIAQITFYISAVAVNPIFIGDLELANTAAVRFRAT